MQKVTDEMIFANETQAHVGIPSVHLHLFSQLCREREKKCVILPSSALHSIKDHKHVCHIDLVRQNIRSDLFSLMSKHPHYLMGRDVHTARVWQKENNCSKW